MTLLESVNERLQKYYDDLERQAIERGEALARPVAWRAAWIKALNRAWNKQVASA